MATNTQPDISVGPAKVPDRQHLKLTGPSKNILGIARQVSVGGGKYREPYLGGLRTACGKSPLCLTISSWLSFDTGMVCSRTGRAADIRLFVDDSVLLIGVVIVWRNLPITANIFLRGPSKLEQQEHDYK